VEKNSEFCSKNQWGRVEIPIALKGMSHEKQLEQGKRGGKVRGNLIGFNRDREASKVFPINLNLQPPRCKSTIGVA